MMDAQKFVTFNIQFNLRHYNQKKPSIIYAVVAFNKKQYKISTGVKVYPTHWNAKKQVANIGGGLTNLDNINNRIANEKIREINNSSEEMKLYLCSSPEELDSKNFFVTLKKYINPNIKSKTKTMTKKRIIENATITLLKMIEKNNNSSDNSKSIYRGHIERFRDFLKLKKLDDNWSNVNLSIIEKWQNHLLSEKKSVGTINNYIITLNTLCKEVDEITDVWDYNDSKIHKVKKIKMKLSKSDVNKQEIALTEEQIMQIYNYDILDDKEIETRDMFVLQCLVGQRISDLDNVLKSTIINNTITIIQTKTKNTATIPLFEISKSIIEKYKKKPLTHLDLSDKTHQARINEIIKGIARKAGLTELTSFNKQQGTEIISFNKPLCDRIHTHTARHSFITMMCRKGIQKDVIMLCSGHTDIKMINEVYEHLNDEDKKNKIADSFSNMNSSLFAMNDNNKKEIITEVQQQPQQQQQLDTINEAKEVLSMLRVDPSLFYNETDISNLWRMVMNAERELLDYGIDYLIVKEIFNEAKTLKERADILHQIFIEAKAIRDNS